MVSNRKLKGWLLTLLMVVCFVSACTPLFVPEEDMDLLSVHVLDVGQGDSILIMTPSQQAILIDGGETQASDRIISYLRDYGIEVIDMLIATHPHADHIGGLPKVIETFEVKEMIMPRVVHTSKTFEKLLLAADAKGISITPAEAGLSYQLEETLTLDILGPLKDYGDELNNWSVIAKITYGDKGFLFTGDAEAEVEAELVATYGGEVLGSNFLKLGHHGSRTSSTPDFLAAVNPEIVAISLGTDNSYGHPHQEVLDRIHGISLYRTDLHGTVVLYSDGESIWSYEEPIQLPLDN